VIRTIVVAALVVAGVVHAEPAAKAVAKPELYIPPPSPPDPQAEAAASEANLESITPRAGMTMSFAVGGALFLGGGGGVGRGGLITARLGHVMTPSTVLQLELVGGSMLHTIATDSKIYRNDDVNFTVGAQYYTSPSLWFRGGGGFGVYTRNDGPNMTQTLPGLAGVFGIGVDLIRRHYFVLGLETYSVGLINRSGLLVSSALGIGISYY
jgi:hypothetical protein